MEQTVSLLANRLNQLNLFEVVNYCRFLSGLHHGRFGPRPGLEPTIENSVVSFRDKSGHPVGNETLNDETSEVREYRTFLKELKKELSFMPEEDKWEGTFKLAQRELHILLNHLSKEDGRAAFRFMEYVVDRDGEED
jgi:hypothetical protein